MTTISMRIPAALLDETERLAREVQVNRTEYIRRAIEAMNREMKERERGRRLAAASRKVRGESRRVNAEFERIDDGPRD